MLLRFSFLISILFSVSVPAQYSVTTPYESIHTFLFNLQDEHFHRDSAALPFLYEGISLEEAGDKAVKLKQILDGRGLLLDLSSIPNQANYVDSVSKKAKYAPVEHFPTIYLTKTNDKWLFSRFSIEQIDKIHQDIYPFGTARLLTVLPRLGTKKYVGLYSWQLIGILSLILVSFVIHKLLTYLFDIILYKGMVKAGYSDVARKILNPVSKPLSLLLIFLILSIFVPILQLPVKVNQYLVLGLRASLPLFATVLAYKLVDILGYYLMKMAERTESTLDDQLVPLVKKSLKTFVVVVGFIFVLQNLNFNVTALVAGLSIGGLAFALAAQDTIKNFFGSLMIFIDRPFQIGHWITSGEIDGTVEEVGFRSTRVRTFRNSLVYVPNGKLADSVIDNHGLRQYRRFYTTIAITYDTPPHLIATFIEGLKQLVLQHPKSRKDFYQIHLSDFGASSLNIMFYIFFAVPSWDEELACRHEIMLSVIDLAHNLGVNFAFPTQTLHVENMPGQPSLSPVYPEKKTLEEKLKAYLNTSGKQGQ